jgi:hypothetical protein
MIRRIAERRSRDEEQSRKEKCAELFESAELHDAILKMRSAILPGTFSAGELASSFNDIDSACMSCRNAS